MIDLHTHTFFSDGVLIPSELVYRARVNGYRAIAITDHGDFSNLDLIIPRIKKITQQLTLSYGIQVLAGIELTYVPPALISKAVRISRRLGAEIVLVHGETPAETVPPGTNHAGILAGIDILAHPGYMLKVDAKLAEQRDVCLEITARRGHNKTNAHVAMLAKETGARLVLNTDSHEPKDLLVRAMIDKILRDSGLSKNDYKDMLKNSNRIVERRK